MTKLKNVWNGSDQKNQLGKKLRGTKSERDAEGKKSKRFGDKKTAACDLHKPDEKQEAR